MKSIKLITIVLLISVPFFTFGQGCDEPSGDEDGVKLMGYFQPQFDYNLTDPVSNTFKFKRARLGVAGTIPYDFTYYMVIENSAFVSHTGNPYLLDAFISYRRFKWAKFSIGSFKQPFSLEVNTPCSGLHTIERSIVADQIVSPQRDMGLMLLGGTKESKLAYSLAVMNGRGLGIKDNNAKKDFIGRVQVRPMEMITFGGSFRYGYPITETDERISIAGELELNVSDFKLQGEYIYDKGDYNRAAGGGCGSDPLVLGDIRTGAWVTAMYSTSLNLQPVIKWEFFDTDADIADNTMYRYTLGVNYFFNDWTRLQINYLYNVEQGAEIPNDAILVQFQVKF